VSNQTTVGNRQTSLARLVWAWEACIRTALAVSVVLIGVGRIDFLSPLPGLSAWSVSRTTFFFWLIGRLYFFWRTRTHWNLTWSECRPLLLFLAAAVFSLVPSFQDLGDFRYLFFALGHGVMVLDVLRKETEQRFVIVGLGLLPALVLLRGLFANPAILDFSLTQRLGYPLDHANTAGHLLAMSLPLSVALLLSSLARWRLLAAGAAVAQLIALLLTYSRGAWLGVAGAMAFLLVALGTRKEFLLILVSVVVLLSAVEPVRERMLGIVAMGNDQATTDRISRMSDALRVGMANPVLGVGYGRGRLKAAIRANPASETSVNEPIWHSHNHYLELFAGTGIIGLGAYLWLLVKAFANTSRKVNQTLNDDRILTLGLAASAVAMLLCGLGDVTFHHHETRLFCFTLLALMLLAHNPERSTGQNTK